MDIPQHLAGTGSQLHHPIKLAADTTAVSVAGASLWVNIPTIAQLISIIYILIQIYITVDHWWKRRKVYKNLHK